MNINLLIDLHKINKRQGPGGDEQTLLALKLAELMDSSQPLKIADIGCGTGASALLLAKNLNANVTAIDLFQEFLDILNVEAQKHKLSDRITTLKGSMEELPFEEGSIDVIWCEGAIYNMGFLKGVEYFKRFLKPGGILAVSEITWLTDSRPEEIQSYWDAAYPEISMASEKMQVLEGQGFTLKGYFPLPKTCWVENYYATLSNSFDDFIAKHNSEEAQVIINASKEEIALYEKYQNYYSYGFYIAERI